MLQDADRSTVDRSSNDRSSTIDDVTRGTASIDRRGFGRSVAAGFAGGVVAAAVPATVVSQDTPPPATRPPSLAALQLGQVVTLCPGDHWDDATLEAVLNSLRGHLGRSRSLSAFPLQNGDDPATIFSAPAPRRGLGTDP